MSQLLQIAMSHVAFSSQVLVLQEELFMSRVESEETRTKTFLLA